ncbi:MAG: hypothetical protein FD123_3455 [Bacteroidetes bacterium]|nr:MAG: hypothetical protein FD123_3455 [Bacteroidota bacterium]
MKKTRLLIALTAVLYVSSVRGQDIHFSQYNFAPLTLNPAYTAAYKNLQATVQYKDQWKSLNGYRTAAATFEMKFDQPGWTKVKNRTSVFTKKAAKGLAVGVQFFSDKAGDGTMKQTQGNLALAWHALLNEKNILSAGLMGGVTQRSINPDGLRWNSQYSGAVYVPNALSGEVFSRESFVYGDYGFGLLWSYGSGSRYLSANDQKDIQAGFSVNHLNTPRYSYTGFAGEKLYRKYTFHANALLGISNTSFSVGPSLLFMQQGVLRELTAGTLVKYIFRENSKYTGNVKSSAVSLGCYYRNKDAVIPYLMYELDMYSIGISYDTNVSGLKTATTGKGGFEIVLRFNSPSSFLYQNKSQF